jgi:HPt (histidine-containing phosphotransfer) domain-containing protein
MVDETGDTSSESPISQEAFHALAEMIGLDMPEVLADLIETYLTEAGGLVEAMLTAHAAGDRAALVRPAHSLKSSSASIGATRLSRLCADLEAHLRGAPTPLDVPRQVAAIAAEYKVAAVALAQERDHLLNT